MKIPSILIALLAAPLLVVSALVLAEPEAVWIDNRTPGEYAGGHVEGATLIPFDAIETGIMELELEKDTLIYLYCGSGKRSGIAKERLEHQGYSRVVNLGGIKDAQAFADKLERCAKSSDAPGCNTLETPGETAPAASAPQGG